MAEVALVGLAEADVVALVVETLDVVLRTTVDEVAKRVVVWEVDDANVVVPALVACRLPRAAAWATPMKERMLKTCMMG